jgi:ribosomal protein S18 acetylase RimI-like enzyme
MIQVRRATSQDLPACGTIIDSQPLWAQYGYHGNDAVRHLTVSLAGGEAVWIAADEEDVVGFAWILPHGAFGRSPYLRLIAVKRGAEGRGIGARLLGSAERDAAGRTFFLLVSSFNEGARRFYERQGYREVGMLPSYVVAGIDEIMMCKRL